MSELEKWPEASVLIVDDVPANLLALQAVLQPVGVTVVEARSGREAIARAEGEQFALVLLDVQMPGMDGFDVARHLRLAESSRETPIIFLTAIHRDEGYARLGYEIGGADYLLKPFDPDILRAKVRSFVDLFNQREHLRRVQVQLRTRERDDAMRQLERALEAERAARREAEEAARRQRFLAVVSAVLASSLDVEATLQAVVKMTVPEMSDWCAVDLIEDGGGISRRAVAASSSAGTDWERFSAVSGALFDVPHALDSKRAEVSPAPAGGGASASPELEALAREHGVTSWMTVPLVRRERPIGALLFAATNARHPYAEADAALAEEIGLRVAMAVENADLYRRAQAAIRIREDFVSIASHELKTPLTPLKLQLASLQRRLPEDRAVIIERLAIADRQVDKMDQLVSQLLDVSKIAAGRLDLQPAWVDLRRIVDRVVERFSVGGGASPLLVRGEPAEAFVDPFRMDQLVTNLVGNALKYGEGKPIEIELATEGEESEAVRITVRDHGIGIDPLAQARIFDRFERAVSVGQYGGFGLGLWIARQVVEASGGKISVASEVGHGAAFSVVLPCGVEHELLAQQAVGG